MKRNEKEKNEILFLNQNAEDWSEIEKELADMEFDVPEISEDELVRLHSRVLEKAGLKKKPRSRRAKYLQICACAAVAVFAVLGAGRAIQITSAKSGSDLLAKESGENIAADTNGVMLAAGLDGGVNADRAPEYGAAAPSVCDAKRADVVYFYAAQSDTEHDKPEQFSQNRGVLLSVQNAVADSDALILELSAETDGLFDEGFTSSSIVVSVTNPDTGAEYAEKIPADSISFYPVSDSEYRIFFKGEFPADSFSAGYPVYIYISDDIDGENRANTGGGISEVSNATWKLSFTLNFVDYPLLYSFDGENRLIPNSDIQLDFAEISPYFICVYGKVLGEETAAYNTVSDNAERVYIELSDGKKIFPTVLFSGYNSENLFNLSFIFPRSVSAEDIRAVYINGEAFILNAQSA